MLLDQRSFEDESFDFIVGDDDFNIGDLFDQFAGFNSVTEVTRPSGLEIRTHAVAQIFRFADIEDVPRGVFVQIDAG